MGKPDQESAAAEPETPPGAAVGDGCRVSGRGPGQPEEPGAGRLSRGDLNVRITTGASP